MDPELKSMLTLLLDKVERIEASNARLEATTARLEATTERLEATTERLDARTERLEDEQRQIKEMIGVVRLKEIGRLDGRIDQLAMDVALGRKPDAA
ncbi:MAG TPA: hypothetical protein VD995_08285 [Azospirillum sp.]|nr:hypothetical protein [Azospirillum sp.]